MEGGAIMGIVASPNVRFVNENAWEVLHARYASAVVSGEWQESLETNWLFVEFVKLIPVSCGCQENAFADLAAIDLTTAESAERTAFDLHNFISSERVSPPKKTISWDEYLQLYPR